MEKNHNGTDFVSSREMLLSLKKFIVEQTCNDRNYKTNFTIQSLASSSVFKELYEANVMLQEELQKKEVAINTAMDKEKERTVALYEERKNS